MNGILNLIESISCDRFLTYIRNGVAVVWNDPEQMLHEEKMAHQTQGEQNESAIMLRIHP